MIKEKQKSKRSWTQYLFTTQISSRYDHDFLIWISCLCRYLIDRHQKKKERILNSMIFGIGYVKKRLTLSIRRSSSEVPMKLSVFEFQSFLRFYVKLNRENQDDDTFHSNKKKNIISLIWSDTSNDRWPQDVDHVKAIHQWDNLLCAAYLSLKSDYYHFFSETWYVYNHQIFDYDNPFLIFMINGSFQKREEEENIVSWPRNESHKSKNKNE